MLNLAFRVFCRLIIGAIVYILAVIFLYLFFAFPYGGASPGILDARAVIVLLITAWVVLPLFKSSHKQVVGSKGNPTSGWGCPSCGHRSKGQSSICESCNWPANLDGVTTSGHLGHERGEVANTRTP